MEPIRQPHSWSSFFFPFSFSVESSATDPIMCVGSEDAKEPSGSTPPSSLDASIIAQSPAPAGGGKKRKPSRHRKRRRENNNNNEDEKEEDAFGVLPNELLSEILVHHLQPTWQLLYAASKVSRQWRSMVCEVLMWRPLHVIGGEEECCSEEPLQKRRKTMSEEEFRRRKVCQPDPIRVKELLCDFYAFTECSASCLREALEHDGNASLGMAKDFFRVGQSGSTDLVDLLVEHNVLGVLHEAHNWTEIGQGAASVNNVDMLKWTRGKATIKNKSIIATALQFGAIDVLEECREGIENILTEWRCDVSDIDLRNWAAMGGHVHAMRWVDEFLQAEEDEEEEEDVAGCRLKQERSLWSEYDLLVAFMSCKVEAVEYILSLHKDMRVCRFIGPHDRARFGQIAHCNEHYFQLAKKHIQCKDAIHNMMHHVAQCGKLETFLIAFRTFDAFVTKKGVLQTLLHEAVSYSCVSIAQHILLLDAQLATSDVWEYAIDEEDTRMLDLLFEACGNKINVSAN